MGQIGGKEERAAREDRGKMMREGRAEKSRRLSGRCWGGDGFGCGLEWSGKAGRDGVEWRRDGVEWRGVAWSLARGVSVGAFGTPPKCLSVSNRVRGELGRGFGAYLVCNYDKVRDPLRISCPFRFFTP